MPQNDFDAFLDQVDAREYALSGLTPPTDDTAQSPSGFKAAMDQAEIDTVAGPITDDPNSGLGGRDILNQNAFSRAVDRSFDSTAGLSTRPYNGQRDTTIDW